MSVERTYAVSVRVEETTKEVVPGKPGVANLTGDKVERSKRDVVSIVVSAGDAETAIRKAIRLLRTELPPESKAPQGFDAQLGPEYTGDKWPS